MPIQLPEIDKNVLLAQVNTSTLDDMENGLYRVLSDKINVVFENAAFFSGLDKVNKPPVPYEDNKKFRAKISPLFVKNDKAGYEIIVNTEKNRLLFKVLKDSLAGCLHALENPDRSYAVTDGVAKQERDQRQAARIKNVKALKAEVDGALVETLLELEAPLEELSEAVTGRADGTLESVLSVLLGKELNAEEAGDALEALYEDKSMKRGLLKRQGNVFGRVNDVDAQRIQCARGSIDQEARALLDNIEALKDAPDDERLGYMLLDDPEVIYSLYEQALVENVVKRMELLDSEVHIMFEGVRTLREAFSKVRYQDVKPSIVRDVFGFEDYGPVAASINRLSLDELMAAAKQEKTVTPDETGGQFVSMLNKHLQPLQEQRTDIAERIEQCLNHAKTMPMLALDMYG
ncbi:MAG: hypothetical protein R3E13_03750 [Alphaproteobacteria bacterium]